MKIFVENNNDGFPIVIGEDTDSTPLGYLDMTSILGVDSIKHLEDYLDYKSIRKLVLQELLKKDADIGTAFGLCSFEEQKIVCKYQLMPYAVRINYFTDKDDSFNWDKLVTLTEGSPYSFFSGRYKVYQDLRVCVSDYVRREIWFPNDYYANLNYAQMFLKKVHLMKEHYIAANDPEFGYFLRSTDMYSEGGFKDQVYWLQDLEDDLLEIYNAY